MKKMMIGVAITSIALTVPAAAVTLEEVIDKHIEARGGQANWDSIETLQVTGTFQAFSVISPFTLTRKGEKYHLDHTLNEKIVVIGYDGDTAWWDNHWFQKGAAEMSGPDLGVVLRDAEFPTPFFHYREKGLDVKLIGETEIEGFSAIGIEVTRGDETETWYLDPESYLEVAKISPGSDFGRSLPQTTFFDDWREVNGVMIAHLTETQWYTRDRVMVIDDIKVNVAVDDALFAMPAPPGMGPFQDLKGSWTVAYAQRDRPDDDWNESEYSTTFESLMGRGMFRETYTDAQGTEVIRTLTYDRHHDEYRLTQVTSTDSVMDIREGAFDDTSGRLTVSNEETGTANPRFMARYAVFELGKDSFEAEWEISIDDGENWWVAAKASYTRAAEEGETASND